MGPDLRGCRSVEWLRSQKVRIFGTGALASVEAVIEPWTVKVDRAAEHIGELRRSIGELKTSGDLAAVTDQQGSERVVRLVGEVVELRNIMVVAAPALLGADGMQPSFTEARFHWQVPPYW